MKNPFTKKDGPLDRGWLYGALHGRLESISVGVYLDRVLWRWPYEVDRYKGTLTINVGPLFFEFGG